MIDIGTTDIYINVPSLSVEALERYSTHLFDDWERQIAGTISLNDYSLALHVEEGSIKVLGLIGASATALLWGISQYGSVISGLEIIRSQVRDVSQCLAKEAVRPFDANHLEPRIKKNQGSLTHLQRLFVKVQSGKMSAEEAMDHVQVLLVEDTDEYDPLVQFICDALKDAPHYPEQIPLPIDEYIPYGIIPGPRPPKLKSTKSNQPTLPQPPENPLYRVEFWRESRKDDRKVRVTAV